MSEMQQQVLQSALARAQREVQAEIQGTWCDALACLLVLEWPRARKHLLTPAPQSTSVVVQAWMQVRPLQQNAPVNCILYLYSRFQLVSQVRMG